MGGLPEGEDEETSQDKEEIQGQGNTRRMTTAAVGREKALHPDLQKPSPPSSKHVPI